MSYRIITGPIIHANGAGLAEGMLRMTQLDYEGEDGEGFTLPVRRAIAEGAVEARVEAPARYRVEIEDADGDRLRQFTVAIPEGEKPLTVRELWEMRGDADPIPAPAIRDGDSIMRLGTSRELGWGMLVHGGGLPTWSTALPNGDMNAATYDPRGLRADLFDRANHSGTQPIASVAGLEELLASLAGAGFDDYAVVADHRPLLTHGGTFTSGADRLRTFNTVELNNSGLADGVLLDAATSAVKLLPGRIYFGWAEAPTSMVGHNYLRLKSTDGSIDVVGPSYISTIVSYPEINVWARVQFRFTIAAGAGAKSVQLLHRCQSTNNTVGMGNASKFEYEVGDEEYAKLTILSRPLLPL